MKTLNMISLFAVMACGLANVDSAQAIDISGTIGDTLTIYDNSQLVGDVTCTVTVGPCIAFGASHIKLRLNGFSITGPAPIPCTSFTVPATTGNGIALDSVSHAAVLGPGLVQRFRRWGILLSGSTNKSTVKQVVVTLNCLGGIQLFNGTFDNEIEENISLANTVGSGTISCGGICVLGSHQNRVRRNETSGNGESLSVLSNDFGIGLRSGSSNNIVEENSSVGNINGIRVEADASNNVIRRNVIAGNPPAQLSATGRVDILDEAPNGANTFEENLCLTYSGLSPNPCGTLPKFSGHRNPSQGSSQGPYSDSHPPPPSYRPLP